jgi:hypothetical protein
VNFGQQKAKILNAYVGVNETSKNIFVNLKLELGSGDKVYSKIYLTEKSMGIARARLKRCGFDPDRQALEDIDQNASLLTGNEVLVDVYEESYQGKQQIRVDVVIDRPKADKSALARATEGLRKAKEADTSDDAPPAPAPPPAVAHIPKEKRERLEAEAKEEDLPF